MRKGPRLADMPVMFGNGRLTGLSVGENACVVALECVVQNIPAEAIEHDVLAGVILPGRIHGIEAVIEGERLWLFPGIRQTGAVKTNTKQDARTARLFRTTGEFLQGPARLQKAPSNFITERNQSDGVDQSSFKTCPNQKGLLNNISAIPVV